MNKDYLFRWDHVSVYYDDFCALHDITMKAQPGDFIALMGANGAGKSTFLNTLMGHLPPKEGTVDFNEAYISVDNPMASIGFSSQKVIMDWYLNVWDNVYLGAALAGMNGKQAKVMTRKALERVSLAQKMKSSTSDLSGGQQQRVQIGRAIVHEPFLYILDEPTTGLDVEIAERFFAFLQEEHQKGKTIIVSSHDLYLLQKYCNKLLYIEKKRIQYFGPMKTFLQKYKRDCRYSVTVCAGQKLPDMEKPHVHFTFCGKDETEKSFMIGLKEGHTLSDALIELAPLCEIEEFHQARENGLREFFVHREERTKE